MDIVKAIFSFFNSYFQNGDFKFLKLKQRYNGYV